MVGSKPVSDCSTLPKATINEATQPTYAGMVHRLASNPARPSKRLVKKEAIVIRPMRRSRRT